MELRGVEDFLRGPNSEAITPKGEGVGRSGEVNGKGSEQALSLFLSRQLIIIDLHF